MSEINYWRKCGSCKKEIGFNIPYQVCNVSTCRKLVFCSVDCWNLHNPVMNHKSSWAEENRSPRKENYSPEQGESSVRRIISAPKNENEENSEILIVVSKLKHYIKEKHDLNTAGNVMEVLTRIIKKYVDGASANAKREGRKTLMDRDFE